MGSKTNSAENSVLDHIVGTSTLAVGTVVYSALFTAISSDAADGTEVTSDCYTRQATTFCTAGATAAGQIVNTGAVTYPTCATAYTVVGWALYDAITAGTEYYWATVTTVAVGVGDQATFGVGSITITED